MQSTKLEQYNSSMLKTLICTKLDKQLKQVQTPFCLYADQNILEIINFVYSYKFLGGSLKGKAYKLLYDKQAIDTDQASNVVFMIYPDPKMIKIIGSMIKSNETNNIKKNYHLFFIPAKDFLCIEALQSHHIKNKIKVKNFNFDFIPLNEDLFSLELSPLLREINQEKYIVESLLRIVNIIGNFKGIYGLGPKSQSILRSLQTQSATLSQISSQQNSKTYLIMLDRELDLITPMLTAFSYESLLDMFFGIKLNNIVIPGYLIDSNKKLENFLLHTSKDVHYKIISGMQIRDVPQYLLEKSQELREKIKQQKDQAQKLDDLQQINEKLMGQLIILQHHKSIVTFLLNQINSCPFINTATLESVALQSCQRSENLKYLSLFYPIEQVLKLEILSSQVSDIGQYFPRYQKTIIQTILQCYHSKHLLTLNNLVENKILKSSKTPLKWKQICQAYDLLPDNPHPYTRIHIIYSSLLVRFVQLFLSDNLSNDMINLIAAGVNATGYKKNRFNKIKKGDTVYIYVVGGITFSEKQCFKLLGEKIGIKFIICTDFMTSGQNIIKRNF